MKLPELKPLPPHIKNDDSDTRGAMATMRLIGPVVVIVLGFFIFLLGLFSK